MEVFLKKIYSYLRRSKNVNPDPKNSMGRALKRLKMANVQPSYIIDIGAAKGTWTKKSLTIWPDAEYFLFEPLEDQIAEMDPSLVEKKRIHVINAVAGEEKGVVEFNVTDDMDGSGVYGSGEGKTISVPVETLDEYASKYNMHKVLVKFDTHGYEIQILKGAKNLLSEVDALIVEVYGFRFSPTTPLFHELSEYLYSKGFQLFDIVDTMRRPKDHAFWQADAVFLKKTHSVFQDSSFK